MLFLALLLGFFSFSFNTVEAAPATGTGQVLQAPRPAAAAGSARLVVKRVRPLLIVAGTGFKPRESVRLTGSATLRVRASARGTFTVRIRSADPCRDLTLRAVGSKGSRASVQYSQLLCIDP
jgi:hypothetical protein